MTNKTKKERLQSPLLDSRIKSANIQKSEGFLGYFLGPCQCMFLPPSWRNLWTISSGKTTSGQMDFRLLSTALSVPLPRG